MKAVAGELVLSVNNGLGDIRAGLKNNSQVLSASGLQGSVAEETLAENLGHYPWAYSSIVVSREGIVTAAAPGISVVRPGFNMSGRRQVEEANAAKAPLVGRAFRMEEGMYAISQSYPVFSQSGEYLGYTDITYSPETFLGRIIWPVMNRTGYDVWVIQDDGTEIFDTSREEIGKNILTDAVYADPSVKQVAARIVSEPSGTAQYTFWDREWNRNITKTAVWETAGIDGARWRVGVTGAEQGSGATRTLVTTPAGPPAEVR
jgi:hypothetical protein